jgi:hypothetical protein
MIRPFVALSFVVCLAACKKEPAPAASKPPSAAAPARAAPPAAPPAPEVAKVPVDDATVQKFVTFDRKYLQTLPARMQRMRDELRKLEKADRQVGPGATAPGAQGANQLLEQMRAEDHKLRADSGLTDEQAHTVQELAMNLATARAAQKGLREQAEKMRAAAASVPQANQAEAQAALQKIEVRLREMEQLTDVRRRFGDASVDAALRHEAELIPLWEEHLQTFRAAMQMMVGGR